MAHRGYLVSTAEMLFCGPLITRNYRSGTNVQKAGERDRGGACRLKHRLYVGLALFGFSGVCALLALYAPILWYLKVALWVGAASFAWRAFRALRAGAALRRSPGHPPALPETHPTGETPSPGVVPPGTGRQTAPDRAEQEGHRELETVPESVVGVLRLMKRAAIVVILVLLVPLILFMVTVGVMLLLDDQPFEGVFAFAVSGFLIWYISGPLLGVWHPQGLLNQRAGGGGDDGGGE